jgi:hypothetical protein
MATRAVPRAATARDGQRHRARVPDRVLDAVHLQRRACALLGRHVRRHKRMKNSAAIRAVLTRFLRSSLSSPRNQGAPDATYRSLNLEVKAMVDGYWKRSTRRISTPLQAEWLLAVALLALASAAATESIIQSHPSVGLAFLAGWAHGMIYCGTL